MGLDFLFRPKKYEVRVRLPDKSRGTYYLVLDEITDWLMDNIDRSGRSYSLNPNMVIKFKYEEDAMAFKLVFG